jgi:AhpD family alkylhydroperoxidase
MTVAAKGIYCCPERKIFRMPHIPILQAFEASKDVKAVYDDFHRRMSFPAPPNFIMTQGHSATVVKGTWDVVRNVLVLGEIPRWTKEMIFVAISNDRQCHYCEAAHIACCRMLGVHPKTLQTLVQNLDALTDPKLHNDSKQSEIMELVAMAALAVYANIISDATAMEPDEMLVAI